MLCMDRCKVLIVAVRQTVYPDLMAKYENPIQHTCDISIGQQWVSIDGQRPEGLCPSAWESMRPFVESLAKGEGNFFDGWMKNPMSAMISCNDGFRPVSFYIEVMPCWHLLLQLQNLYCLAIDVNGASLLKLVESTLQGILLNAEMIGQFLSRHRKSNSVGLLAAVFLL